MNSPWPNLKKLVLLASTTAMMTIFFPDLSATNGFIFRAGTMLEGADVVLKNHGNNLCSKVRSGAITGCAEVMGTEAGAPGGGRFWRGAGRGLSGRISNRSVSSWRVGIGVVRPLQGMN